MNLKIFTHSSSTLEEKIVSVEGEKDEEEPTNIR